MKPIHYSVIAVCMVFAALGGYFTGSASQSPVPDSSQNATTEKRAPDEPTPDEYTWSDLALALDIEGRQGSQIVRSLNGLKDTFLETSKLDTASGETSPFAYLCAAIETSPDQSQDTFYRDFLDYMRANTPEGSEQTYFEFLHTKEIETYKQIADGLDPQRRETFLALSIDSLYDIDTGYDPFQSELDKSHRTKSPPDNQGTPQ